MLSIMPPEDVVKVIRDGIATLKSRSWSRTLIVRRLDGRKGEYIPMRYCINVEDALSYLFDLSIFGNSIYYAEMEYQFPGYAIDFVVDRSEDGSTNIDADVIEAISDFFTAEV